MPVSPSNKESSTANLSERVHDPWRTKEALLSSTLCIAVPLWIEELRERPWEYIQERATTISSIIGEKGDVILFRSKKKGETADAFNALAEGIACLSFVPGGVKCFGSHWESCLDDEIPGRSRLTLSNLLSVIQEALKK